MRVSLCLLVWNELEGCQIDITKLPRQAFEEVYAVDGGSTDGTVQYLESQGIPVYRQPKGGLNAAYHHAVEKSTCEAVVVFFPKGTIDPATLLAFRPLLEQGNQMVVASRNMRGGRNEQDDRVLKVRKWCVLALAALAAVVWRREGHFVRDILHGYKGFTISAFKQMAPTDHGLSIDLEMTVRSYRLSLPRAEFPVAEFPREFGGTHFKILPTGVKLLKYLWLECRRR